MLVEGARLAQSEPEKGLMMSMSDDQDRIFRVETFQHQIFKYHEYQDVIQVLQEVLHYKKSKMWLHDS